MGTNGAPGTEILINLRFRRCYFPPHVIYHDHLAAKITDEVKDSIIREFRKGRKSKAQLARDHEISPSTVARILANAQPRATAGGRGTGSSDESSGKTVTVRKDADEEIETLLSGLREYAARNGQEGQGTDIAGLLKDFIAWLEHRDSAEREKIALGSEIDSLKLEKSTIEDRIFKLGSKAANMEITIGRMRAEAEKANLSMEEAEDRLARLEERMEENRNLLILTVGLLSLMERGELDEETINLMGKFKNLWTPDEAEISEKVRTSMLHYMEMASSRLRGWKK